MYTSIFEYAYTDIRRKIILKSQPRTGHKSLDSTVIMYVYVNIYIHICSYVYTYVCTCIYIYILTCTYVYLQVKKC